MTSLLLADPSHWLFFLSSGILRSVLNELVFVRLLQLELMHVLLVLRWPRLVCLRRVRPLFV